MKSCHTGIFERNDDGIQEIMGSSIPQMLGHEEVTEKLTKETE